MGRIDQRPMASPSGAHGSGPGRSLIPDRAGRGAPGSESPDSTQTRAPGLPRERLYARSRNQATACRSPSSTGYCGSYPKASRARVMSASESRMSPARVAS
jgi:hypothetical protein